jgi:hypothetical protein
MNELILNSHKSCDSADGSMLREEARVGTDQGRFKKLMY